MTATYITEMLASSVDHTVSDAVVSASDLGSMTNGLVPAMRGAADRPTDGAAAKLNAVKSPGLEAADVGLVIGRHQLVAAVSLKAPPGSLTAVIGPSGCGKTSLARMLCGEVRPTTGTVNFDGFDLHHDPSALRGRIGMVPQDDVVHRQLTVAQALAYGAQLRLPRADRQGCRDAVTRVLRELELTDHADRRIDTLSGGQRKRVSVALELLTEPALLILDEPTAGLDLALDRRVMTMLRQLADAGRVIVVVTHSLTYLHVCDQVLLIGLGGKPAYCGPPELIGEQMGTTNWADIYTLIGTDPDGMQNSVVVTSGNPAPRCARRAGTRRRVIPHPAQFATIAHRQVRLIMADRQYLLFLVLMPIILGFLSLAVAGNAGLATPGPHELWPNEAPQLLSLLIVGTIFMGTSLSLRDLLGERAIFRREQAVGLSTSYYLFAKVIVFGVAVTMQVTVLFAIVLMGKRGPDRGPVALGEAGTELLATLILTGIVAAALGLAMSAVAKSHEQLLPMLVVTIMAQIVFSGGLIPVTGRVGLDQVSWLWPARWGFAATASTVDLRAIAPLAPADERLWSHSLPWWCLDVAMLVLQATVLTAFTRWRLGFRCH